MPNIALREDVQQKIKNGIDTLADAVAITLGPTGRVAIYERSPGDPIVSKDGITIARQIELDDPMENMASKMVCQAAAKTAIAAGDGTTTATIYTRAIYNAGLKSIKAGANCQEIKSGIDHGVSMITQQLANMAKPVVNIEQIQKVATCSVNQDKELGDIIAKALDEVGQDGVVTIEEGRQLQSTVIMIDGFQLPRGFISPQFVTNIETFECEFDNPNILVTSHIMSNLKSFMEFMQNYIAKYQTTPLVIIAEEYSDEAINLMILNKRHIRILPIKAPGFGEHMENNLGDIAATVGTSVVDKNVDLSRVNSEKLGTCKRIKANRDTTTIITEKPEEGSDRETKISERINLLKSQLENIAGDYDREKIQDRLARLTGSVAQILVGGTTDLEVREKKDRVDDALHACKAAIEEGILPGGGVSVIHALRNTEEYHSAVKNDDFLIGVNIVFEALESPIRQIAINTGKDEGVVVDKVRQSSSTDFGFNAITNNYGDMIEDGIIVPAKVERIALQNAASIASMLLAADCLITIDRNTEPQQQQPQFPSLG